MKNKNIKLIIISLTILTIVTCVVISIQTYSQYKKISVRESISIPYVQKYITNKVCNCIDPSLLIDMEDVGKYNKGQRTRLSVQKTHVPA